MPNRVNRLGTFYTTYKHANSAFNPDTFRCAEETVEELLAKATTSDNPGMLLGKVQSGKTRTFISILALAFDNGFDVAIVLSKNSRALLEQTAKRLNSEFEMFVNDAELEIYDIMHAPDSFGAFELQSKLIFVAKKQSDNLRRLIDLFSKNLAMAAQRTLIIDDEADSASVGYTKKEGLIEAKKIATQINSLRSAIRSSSYLQVTATPYSLYLQPTEIEVANVLTFRPTRPAFTRLVPVPPEYVGGETYFGEAARSESDTLESLIHYTVDHNEFDRLKKPDGRSFKLDDVLTAPPQERLIMPAMPSEFKTHIDSLKTMIADLPSKQEVARMQSQVDAIDLKMSTRHIADSSFGAPTLAQSLKENEGVQRILRDRRGSAVINLKGAEVAELMSRKTIISGITSGSAGTDTLNPVGAATSGVLQIDRTSGITPEARPTLRIREVLPARPTTMQIVDFVKVSSPMAVASPVAEGSIKPENSVSFSSVSEKVRTLATWIPATRQVLDDFTELYGYLATALPYYVNLEEELQLLSGDNSGENLHGLIPQASAFNTSFLPPAASGWTRIDVLGAAIAQLNAAKEIDPTFAVVNTNDWWKLALTKDSLGRYLLGNPQDLTRPRVFGLDIVPTTSIAAGTFLVGSGSPIAAEIRDRMEMTVEISTEHSDYFTRNLVAIRAEKRLALVTKRAGAFISGTFTTSP